MTAAAEQSAIKAAMSVARDVAEGRLHPAELDAAASEECRALFGLVTGPQDALWPLQADVCRQVLAAGGVPAGELAEWLAVARHPADGTGTAPASAAAGVVHRCGRPNKHGRPCRMPVEVSGRACDFHPAAGVAQRSDGDADCDPLASTQSDVHVPGDHPVTPGVNGGL